MKNVSHFPFFYKLYPFLQKDKKCLMASDIFSLNVRRLISMEEQGLREVGGDQVTPEFLLVREISLVSLFTVFVILISHLRMTSERPYTVSQCESPKGLWILYFKMVNFIFCEFHLIKKKKWAPMRMSWQEKRKWKWDIANTIYMKRAWTKKLRWSRRRPAVGAEPWWESRDWGKAAKNFKSINV